MLQAGCKQVFVECRVRQGSEEGRLHPCEAHAPEPRLPPGSAWRNERFRPGKGAIRSAFSNPPPPPRGCLVRTITKRVTQRPRERGFGPNHGHSRGDGGRGAVMPSLPVRCSQGAHQGQRRPHVLGRHNGHRLLYYFFKRLFP